MALLLAGLGIARVTVRPVFAEIARFSLAVFLKLEQRRKSCFPLGNYLASSGTSRAICRSMESRSVRAKGPGADKA